MGYKVWISQYKWIYIYSRPLRIYEKPSIVHSKSGVISILNTSRSEISICNYL
jgi:hypothetical protein